MVQIDARYATAVTHPYLSHVGAFDGGTTIRLINCFDMRVDDVGGDGSQQDMNSTLFDIQGGGGRMQFSGASIINHFTFLNDNSSPKALNTAAAVVLDGCRAEVKSGGTLINHQGARLIATGCNLSSGNIIIGPNVTNTSFSATCFAPGGGGDAPTTFTYAFGAPQAIFDPSCQEVPASADVANVFGSPNTELSGMLSAAIGGQLGSDFGRTGYLAFPSAANFSNPGDRQTGQMTMGAVTNSGTASARLTADGNAVAAGGANSFPLSPEAIMRGIGNVIAYNPAAARWAIWSDIDFIATSGSSTLTYLRPSSTGTPSAHGGAGSDSWSFGLAMDTINNCLSATGTAGSNTIHWLFSFSCLDIG